MTAEESVSDPKSNDPSATGVREAVLVLDTKAEAPALGLRDTGRFERCLRVRGTAVLKAFEAESAEGKYVKIGEQVLEGGKAVFNVLRDVFKGKK